MHDCLFKHQNALDECSFIGICPKGWIRYQEIEIEISKHVYAPAINDSLINGIKSGVEGTPTFFLNGKRYDGSWDLETLSKKLRSKIR